MKLVYNIEYTRHFRKQKSNKNCIWKPNEYVYVLNNVNAQMLTVYLATIRIYFGVFISYNVRNLTGININIMCVIVCCFFEVDRKFLYPNRLYTRVTCVCICHDVNVTQSCCRVIQLIIYKVRQSLTFYYSLIPFVHILVENCQIMTTNKLFLAVCVCVCQSLNHKPYKF